MKASLMALVLGQSSAIVDNVFIDTTPSLYDDGLLQEGVDDMEFLLT